VALVALVLSEEYVVLQNILFSLATISAGYHVIILEGMGETVENTKIKKKV
jgi:Cd2+/Zn2+-exporting ATPase